MSDVYDVAIVGYGPVGATFANLLSRYGLAVAVVEQAADFYDKPRAITLDHEVLRVFQACGLAEAMEMGIAAHPGTHYLGVDKNIIKIFDPMLPPWPLGWVPTATFVQPDVERALRAKLAEYPTVEVFLSTRATGLAKDADGVSLTVQPPGSGPHTLRARYLVGCDGANSFVRKSLGVRLDDLAFDEWWMVVDAFAADLGKRPNKCFQYCWPSRPGTFIPGPGALRRWEIKLLPGETPDDFAGSDRILQVLAGFTDPSDLTIWRSAVYRFHALLAERWRMGRIFLMGDAVHQTPPFLGQGLSAGVRDAFNLAWKLAFVLRDKAGDSLLDSYEEERKPHVGAVIATAKEFGRIIGELNWDAAHARDQRLRAELHAGTAETVRQKYIPDLKSGLIAKDAPLTGALFVQPTIRQKPHRVVRLDELLAPSFALVSATPEPMTWMTPSSRQIWRRIGGEQIIIAAGDAGFGKHRVLKEDGRLFSDWLLANGVAVVIARPDRYVFGAATNADQLNGLINELYSGLGFEGQGPNA